MIKPELDLRVILIGGSSHAGKSTLARSLSSRLGWRHICTDALARHPGRPWKKKPDSLPNHVAEHYLALSTDELVADVLCHYNSLWTDIEALITSHATDRAGERLILEGSALWPESVATLNLGNVAAIWLTAGNDLFQSRIYNESRFSRAAPHEKAMIQKFLGRTHLYDKLMMDAVDRLGLESLHVEGSSTVKELSDRCLRLVG